MGRNTALHSAPQAINQVGSSLAKIFTQSPAYYQKGQQLALMQKMQEQQIASGAASQQVTQNKIDASNAIAAAIKKFGGEQHIYTQDEGGNFILRPEVGQAMAAAALSADPTFDISKIQNAMGPAKPLSPVNVPADGGKTLFDPIDRRNPNHKPSGVSAAAIRGVEPPLPEADPTPDPSLSSGDSMGVIPGAGGAPVAAKAVPFDSPLVNAAAAGVNPNVFENPAKQVPASKPGSKSITDLAEIDSGLKDVEAAKAAAQNDKGAFNFFQHLPSEAYQKFVAGAPDENGKTASLIANAAAAYRLAHSGKATTAAEEARNEQVIPHMYDRQVDVMTKLGTIGDALTNKRSSLVDAIHIGGESMPNSAAPSPSPSAAPSAAIPEAAIQFLKQNPHAVPDFEAKYGAGSAKSILGIQ